MIEQEVQSLEPDAVLDLLTVDLTPIGTPTAYNFYAGLDSNYGHIIYRTVDYSPWPVEASGFEKTGQGPQNRPSLSLSNVNGYFSNIMQLYEDVVGASVTRIRTFAKYTDNGAAPDANAFILEKYYVDRKVVENKEVIQLELATPIDFMNRKLPGRIMIANTCPWGYKDTETCQWPGTNPALYYDRNGNPVGSQSEDVCGKRLSDCKLRYNGAAGTNNDPLPYGGFPGLGRF